MEYINIDHPVASTIKVMEWIRDNNCPELHTQFFSFDGKTDAWNTLIVSSANMDCIKTELLLHPLETWFDYKGIKRIMPHPNIRLWYVYINGHYYYITD